MMKIKDNGANSSIRNKILLINSSEIKDKRNVDSPIVAPIGLFFINGYLNSLGYETKIMQLFTAIDSKPAFESKDYSDNIRNEISEFNPDYIGYSFRNLIHEGEEKQDKVAIEHFSVSLDKFIVDFLRSISSAPIIGGGSAFSIIPELYMKHLGLDYGIIGEGEVAFNELITNLEVKGDIANIPGLVYWDNEKIKINNNLYIKNLSSLPAIRIEDFNQYYELYYKIGGHASIQTKRGCSFNCIYCSYPFLEGSKYRLRNIDTIISEIMMIKSKYNMDKFFFVDSVFSTPVDHSVKLCEKLIESNANIKWTAYINPRGIDEEVLKVYKEAGCYRLIFTPDSLSDRVLKSYRKGFDIYEVKQCIDVLKNSKIPFEVQCILGGPGEDEDTVDETIQFCEDNLKDIQVFFQLGMIFYLSRLAIDNFKNDPVLSEIVNIDITRAVLNNDLQTLEKCFYFFSDVGKGDSEKVYNILEKLVSKNRIPLAADTELGDMVYKAVKSKIKKGLY